MPASPTTRTTWPWPVRLVDSRAASNRARSATRPMSRPGPVEPTSRWSRSPRRRWMRTAPARPRTVRSPTVSTSSRLRADRSVASSSRISPGSASSWRRIAVVTVSPVTVRSLSPAWILTLATTSPVASRPAAEAAVHHAPGQPPSGPRSWPGHRVQPGAASSSWARRAPNTANTASPMNFSTMPP